jgi:fumarate hydratase class II
MDAVPMTLGQEFSGYEEQIKQDVERLEMALPHLYELAIGGTAVGTGMNAPSDFGELVAKEIAKETGFSFVSAPNKFQALASKDPFVFASGALKTLACSLIKIANDIRLLGSGPRSGFAELILPANEPGSSIMPGKVNPTQCEAITMAAVHVIGNDTSITLAATQGNFELNVYMPVIVYNILESIELLSDAIRSFSDHLLKGLKANERQIRIHLERSLMLVTYLTPKIGYDKAAMIAKLAFDEDITLKEAALKLGFLTEEEFDSLMSRLI